MMMTMVIVYVLFILFLMKQMDTLKKKNGNKYLVFASTDKKTKKYKPGRYNKKFIKKEIDSDDYLPLNKILKLHSLIIVPNNIFQEDSRYYQQVFFS